MTPKRLPFAELSPAAYKGLVAVNVALDKSSLGKYLVELAYLRTSQINGCHFCIAMHTETMRKVGTPQEVARIDSVASWRDNDAFTERERAALAWIEAVTHIAQTRAPDDVYDALRVHFSDAEISDLTYAVALMNAFNRLAIAMQL